MCTYNRMFLRLESRQPLPEGFSNKNIRCAIVAYFRDRRGTSVIVDTKKKESIGSHTRLV